MKHFLSKRWAILLLMLMPLLVSLACLTLTNVPTEVAPTPDSQTPESETIQADVVFGSGPFNFPDTKAGLSDLTSYKASLILSFDGTRAGQTEQWSKTYVMLTTQEPVTRQLTLEKTGAFSDLDTLFLAEANGTAYERRGENACHANVIEEGNSLSDRLEPAGFLNSVIGAEEAGSETVNEVAANHYTFDERAFGQLGLAKSTGEMWVASEGGYIVKYFVTTSGNADYFGEGIEGTLTWDYELTDVNASLTFALPTDCPAGMLDAPLLPDASNILNMPSVLSYDTSTSLAEAAAFYRAQIPNLGWTLVGEPANSETTVLMEFTQGNQTLKVIITTNGVGTKIHIVLENVQK